METRECAATELSNLADEWDQLVYESAGEIQGTGPISLFQLSTLAASIRAPASELRVYTAEDQDRLRAVLPCFLAVSTFGPLKFRSLRTMGDLYPGRTGPVFLKERPDALRALLKFVLQDRDRWDAFELRCVVGAPYQGLLLEVVAELGLHYQVTAVEECPYIELPATWEALFSSFSKKFRYNMTARRKKLEKQGTLRVDRYAEAHEAQEFLRLMEYIERQSWKERAGTSITRDPAQSSLHRKLVEVCARNGSLRSYVMFSQDEPIAHIIGVYLSNTFFCLKSSFSHSYRKYSPGVVLKATVLQELIDEGAKFWDFVGPAQEHKMQWTEKTYQVETYSVFQNNVRGRLFQARERIGRRLRGRAGARA